MRVIDPCMSCRYKWITEHFFFLFSFLLFALLVLGTPAAATQPTPDTQVGDIVTDPATGQNATVTGLLQDDDGSTYGVTTDAGRLIYTTTVVGNTFPADDGNWTITAVNTNASGHVDKITMERTVVTSAGPPEITEVRIQILPVAVVYGSSNPVDEDGNPIAPDGAPGEPEMAIDPPPAATGDSNYIYVKRRGASGDDGRDGYGVRVCIPYTDICTTVAYKPKPGEDGSTGPTITVNVPSSTYSSPRYSLITTASNELAGITAISIGGNGGEGGDAYGNIAAENGGDAGDGGNVTVNTNTTISTSGREGHGVFAQSRAGVAGDGGKGYILSYGGDSGDTAKGGTVQVTNGADGLISTTGDRAYGVFAQSIGGASGSGGDSWGIVGEGGNALQAGHGGTVSVTH